MQNCVGADQVRRHKRVTASRVWFENKWTEISLSLPKHWDSGFLFGLFLFFSFDYPIKEVILH